MALFDDDELVEETDEHEDDDGEKSNELVAAFVAVAPDAVDVVVAAA